MYKTKSGSRRRQTCAALVSILTMLLVLALLAGCKKGQEKEAGGTQSAPATSAPTAAAPETSLPAEATEAARQDSTAPSTSEVGTAAETLPADWVPSLNSTDISFFGPGESFVLTVPGAAGYYDVLWSAEDEAIAAVDGGGRVTAVGPGSARIYAEVAGTQLTCWIRCRFDAPPAEDAPTLNSTDISFFGVGERYRLSVSNVPEDADILWSSEDYGVAYVDGDGRVRAVGSGTVQVHAQVGDTVLACWVRCQFPDPDVPRSSVADGSWRVTLHKSRITVRDEEAGVFVAQAELLERIRVTGEELEGLEPYDKLDLSRFGLETYRVTDAAFDAEGKTCTVTAGETVLRFSADDSGLWTLLDENGAARYYSAGTGRFVFTDDSRVCEQTGGDTGSEVRVADVTALFGRHSDSEEAVSPVVLTVSDGLVTEAVLRTDHGD